MIKDNHLGVLNKQMIICNELISTYYLKTNSIVQTKNFVRKNLEKPFQGFKNRKPDGMASFQKNVSNFGLVLKEDQNQKRVMDS